VNSFLLYSKSDIKSSNTSINKKSSAQISILSKKSSFYSSEAFSLSISPKRRTSLESNSEFFHIKNSESLIHETKREAIESIEDIIIYNTSCDTRLKGDINIKQYMSNFHSLAFKEKQF